MGLVGPLCGVVLGVALLVLSGFAFAEVVEGGSALPGLVLMLLGLSLLPVGVVRARRAARARHRSRLPPPS